MEKDSYKARVLIVGRVAWTKDESTLSGIFGGFAPEQLAYICIETREPDFTKCKSHFQISETAMIRRFFSWHTPTGATLTTDNHAINEKNEQQEKAVLGRVRAHRSFALLFMRELLWRVGHWKSKALKRFIADFNPDEVFCVGDPLPLMNKLQRYIMKIAEKPGIFFLMDDIWSYKTCHGAVPHIYRWLLRKQVKPLVHLCDAHFAISPKMKREYDAEFGIDCQILTKGIEMGNTAASQSLHTPISLVYTGNLLYGRLNTLSVVVKVIRQINEAAGNPKAELHVYTQTQLNGEDEKRLNTDGVCTIHKPVPYEQLSRVYSNSDIVLFIESLEERYKYVARLSFSTKLTDYMKSGKCIFAIGAEDIAPIEYLQEAGIAVVCVSEEEIPGKLSALLDNGAEIVRLGAKAYEYGQQNHDKIVMNNRLNMVINKLNNLSISQIGWWGGNRGLIISQFRCSFGTLSAAA